MSRKPKLKPVVPAGVFIRAPSTKTAIRLFIGNPRKYRRKSFLLRLNHALIQLGLGDRWRLQREKERQQQAK